MYFCTYVLIVAQEKSFGIDSVVGFLISGKAFVESV